MHRMGVRVVLKLKKYKMYLKYLSLKSRDRAESLNRHKGTPLYYLLPTDGGEPECNEKAIYVEES